MAKIDKIDTSNMSVKEIKAREFNRNNNADKKKYGTYDKYLEAMYRKYVLNENA